MLPAEPESAAGQGKVAFGTRGPGRKAPALAHVHTICVGHQSTFTGCVVPCRCVCATAKGWFHAREAPGRGQGYEAAHTKIQTPRVRRPKALLGRVRQSLVQPPYPPHPCSWRRVWVYRWKGVPQAMVTPCYCFPIVARVQRTPVRGLCADTEGRGRSQSSCCQGA